MEKMLVDQLKSLKKMMNQNSIAIISFRILLRLL
jgi:hypothetical protein